MLWRSARVVAGSQGPYLPADGCWLGLQIDSIANERKRQALLSYFVWFPLVGQFHFIFMTQNNWDVSRYNSIVFMLLISVGCVPAICFVRCQDVTRGRHWLYYTSFFGHAVVPLVVGFSFALETGFDSTRHLLANQLLFVVIRLIVQLVFYGQVSAILVLLAVPGYMVQWIGYVWKSISQSQTPHGIISCCAPYLTAIAVCVGAMATCAVNKHRSRPIIPFHGCAQQSQVGSTGFVASAAADDCNGAGEFASVGIVLQGSGSDVIATKDDNAFRLWQATRSGAEADSADGDNSANQNDKISMGITNNSISNTPTHESCVGDSGAVEQPTSEVSLTPSKANCAGFEQQRNVDSLTSNVHVQFAEPTDAGPEHSTTSPASHRGSQVESITETVVMLSHQEIVDLPLGDNGIQFAEPRSVTPSNPSFVPSSLVWGLERQWQRSTSFSLQNLFRAASFEQEEIIRCRQQRLAMMERMARQAARQTRSNDVLSLYILVSCNWGPTGRTKSPYEMIPPLAVENILAFLVTVHRPEVHDRSRACARLFDAGTFDLRQEAVTIGRAIEERDTFESEGRNTFVSNDQSTDSPMDESEGRNTFDSTCSKSTILSIAVSFLAYIRNRF